MARCNPCLLLIPLPIVACTRSRSAASTWFTSIIFVFFWLALIAGIDECARGTCADASAIWAFLVFFYIFALFLQFDLFDEEYVSYKERRERFRDAEERARLLEEKKQKEFRKKYSFQTMVEDAERAKPRRESVALRKARRDSADLQKMIDDEKKPMTKKELIDKQMQLITEIQLAQGYDDEEKNVLVAIFERDLEKIEKQLNALNANNTDRRKSAFYVRGDRVPRFSDVV